MAPTVPEDDNFRTGSSESGAITRAAEKLITHQSEVSYLIEISANKIIQIYILHGNSLYSYANKINNREEISRTLIF